MEPTHQGGTEGGVKRVEGGFLYSEGGGGQGGEELAGEGNRLAKVIPFFRGKHKNNENQAVEKRRKKGERTR